MQWQKITLEDRFLAILVLLGVILMIFSFYMNSSLMFASSMMIFIIAFANSYYLKHVGEGFFFENKREKSRFFIEDEGVWLLAFTNNGLPIMKGRLVIYFDSAVVPAFGEYHVHQSRVDVSVPLSIRKNEIATIRIPFTAEKRGYAKIRRMEVLIPHYFGFGETILEFKDVVKMEAIIYPKKVKVRNMDRYQTTRPGSMNSPFSLFEDQIEPVGTRDYLPTDSFNRINWKASARKMSLQTKEFERITEAGTVLFVNVADGFSITGKLEFLMSSIAEMAYFLHNKDVPISLCMNIRTAGGTPFAYIPIGTGKDQLQKILDYLAMADYHSPTIPFEKMLFFYRRHLPAVPAMIHAGIRNEAADNYFKEFQKDGIKLLELHQQGEEAFLIPLKIPMKVVAAHE